MINPQNEHRMHRIFRIAVVVGMLGALAWGLMPVRQEAVGITDFPNNATSLSISKPDSETIVVAAEAFDLTLWYTPPIVKKPETRSLTKTRVSFELLAISGVNDDIRYSVVYDSQDDSIHTLSIGESIRGYTVSEIRNDSIFMTIGNKTLRLALDSEDAG